MREMKTATEIRRLIKKAEAVAKIADRAVDVLYTDLNIVLNATEKRIAKNLNTSPPLPVLERLNRARLYLRERGIPFRTRYGDGFGPGPIFITLNTKDAIHRTQAVMLAYSDDGGNSRITGKLSYEFRPNI